MKMPPSRWKGKLCPKCGGQFNASTALNLKDEKGRPLKYVACPGDCDGQTRRDLAAVAKK